MKNIMMIVFILASLCYSQEKTLRNTGSDHATIQLLVYNATTSISTKIPGSIKIDNTDQLNIQLFGTFRLGDLTSFNVVLGHSPKISIGNITSSTITYGAGVTLHIK